MDLSRLLDDVLSSHAIEVLESGERLVALRLPDGSAVGVRLGPTDWVRRWEVLEVVVRPVGDLHDVPLAVVIAEARRLATRSAEPTTLVG